jgi:steroid 5-alpha reductase family enzyme
MAWLGGLALDALYGSLPAPTFVVGGRVMPELLMERVPGAALSLVAAGSAAGLAALGLHLGGPAGLVSAVLPIAVHWALFFGHSVPNGGSEKLFDLAGMLAFQAMNWQSLALAEGGAAMADPRALAVSVLSLIWSLRLGAFLFSRFLERRADFRFVKARAFAGYSLFAWTQQGSWCFLQGLALLTLHRQAAADTVAGSSFTGWTTLDVAGWLVFWCGLFVETLADLQKLAFVRRYEGHANRPFIQEGLWAWSQHPNYAGESTVHLGIFLSCASGLPQRWQLICGVSSVLFSVLFLMQTSVPWLDHLASKRYGSSTEYRRYVATTSKYWLLPKRRL